MSERIETIKTRLNQALQPTLLEVIDDSAQHAGHAGARDGGGHFTVIVSSLQFTGKTPLQRHRLVYAALGDLMETGIHALSIQALAPEDVAE